MEYPGFALVCSTTSEQRPPCRTKLVIPSHSLGYVRHRRIAQRWSHGSGSSVLSFLEKRILWLAVLMSAPARCVIVEAPENGFVGTASQESGAVAVEVPLVCFDCGDLLGPRTDLSGRCGSPLRDLSAW
jgi:hypothetical protein